MNNGQIPDQGFWSSGSLEHLIQIAIPIVIWVIIVYFGHRAFKSGIKLFHQDGGSQVEKLQPLPESEESLREVVAYSGFDPDIYGSLPESEVAWEDPHPAKLDGEHSETEVYIP